MARPDAPVVDPGSATAWRAWLAANHADSPGAWLVVSRRAGETGLSYEDSICEALCFGWVDGQSKVLPDGRSTLWYTRRRPGSGWAATNKARIARLTEQGRMEPAGLAVIEQAKANGTWTMFDDAEALIEHPLLRAALDAEPAARATWDGYPPSLRKQLLSWIATARREETRANRVATIVATAARGERPS